MTETEQPAPGGMNESAPGTTIGSELTQAGSGFDLENTRRELIAKRVAVGANTPIGHRCSNLIEQLDAYRTAEGEQRQHLAKSIARSIADFDAFQ